MSGQITVGAKGGISGGPISSSLMDKNIIKKIEKIDGVKAVERSVDMFLKEDDGSIQMGMPEILEGYEIGSGFKNIGRTGYKVREGRDLKKNDKKKIVIGSDIAKDYNLQVGDYYKPRNTKFKVIGIIDKMMTAPDKMVFAPLKDVRRLYVDSQPFLKNLEKRAKQAKKINSQALKVLPPKMRQEMLEAKDFSLEDVTNSLGVSWEKGTNPENLAQKIEKEVDGVYAMSPDEATETFKNASIVINLIIMGSALIAVIVGGLSVINTMIISVNERTREIGIKRAVGARTRHILTDYLIEAGIIGLIGGLIGLGLAVLTVQIINSNTIKSGVEIFAVTSRLATMSIGFAVILGVLAGIYPAIHASRLNPVTALREE